jgi:peptidoglycan-N-acetylglucosamine deacetylase
VRFTRRARVLLWLTAAIVAMDGRLLPGDPLAAVAVEGHSVALSPGLTVEETLERLGMRSATGDLLTVDLTVLRRGAVPPRVQVNGEPAAWTRRLRGGDRVTVRRGSDLREPVVHIVKRFPPEKPGNPMRSLVTGPVRLVLERGRLSGRVVSLGFRSAAGAPLPVALTFDDGPWPGTTEQILAILARLRAPATFYVVGRQAEQHPALVRRALAAGMAVGTHSFSHPEHFGRLPMEGIRAEITKGRKALERLGVRPVGFRPPGGAASRTVLAAAEHLGWPTVLWTIDPLDWQPGVTPHQIVRRVLAAARPGAIVLLHDGGGDRSATVAALPDIITGLRRLGLTPTVMPPSPPAGPTAPTLSAARRPS